MKKPKLDNVAGLVALSYLVLIPAEGIFLWNRIQMVETEIAEVRRYLDEKKREESK